MNGRQKPDAQPDRAKDLDDEEIIDLTHVVEEKSGEEIIDLTNVIDQPEEQSETLDETTDPLPKTDESIVDHAAPDSANNAGEETDSTPKEVDVDERTDLSSMEKTLEADIAAPETGNDETVNAESDSEAEGLTTPDVDLEGEHPPVSVENIDPTGTGGDAKDDEVIDLSGMETAPVAETPDQTIEEGVDDDEIIDLSGMETAPVAETPDQTIEEGVDDDEIIDLSGMETAPVAETPDQTIEENVDDDEIIDLSGMETAPVAEPPDRTTGESQYDDEIIDLMDTVAAETDESEGEDTVQPPSDEAIAPTVKQDHSPADEIVLTAEEEQAFSHSGEQAEDTGEGDDTASISELSSTGTVPFTEQQIEAALERTVHKIYAEKIERLLIQTIEKTVQREIDKIKYALMENFDDASN